MFEFVDKIVYINLAHRQDRKQSILEEFSRVSVPEDKIERFDAIKMQNGAIGCTMSHIAVLMRAIDKGWKNYMVVEDDMQWENFSDAYQNLSGCYSNHDVVILGGSVPQFQQDKLVYCQTTTGYLVHSHYYQTLLDNFQHGLNNLLATGNKPLYAIDMYWNHLIKKDNWTLLRPCLVSQKPGHSDIEGCHVNYSHLFR
jgi:glycosyl transferase family 25